MSKFFSLFREQLKQSFNPAMLSYYRKHDKKQFRKSLVYLIVIPALLPSFILYVSMLKFMYNALASVNQSGALLGLGTVSVSIVILVFGLSYVFTSFFGAKDMDMLLSMPLKPRDILSSKLLVIIIWEYIFAVPFVAPVFIIYGIGQSCGIIYWLYAVIFTLLLPVIPIAGAGILSLIFVRVFGAKVNTDTVQVIFMVLTLAGVVLLNRYSSSLGNVNITEEQLLSTLLADDGFLLGTLAAKYFPGNLMAQALIRSNTLSGALYFLGAVAINVAAFALIIALADAFYLRTLTAGVSKGGKVKVLSEQGFGKATATSSKAIAIFKSNFRVLLRTPIYAFNTVAMVPLMPIILLATMRGSGEAGIAYIRTFYTQSPAAFSLILVAIVSFIVGTAADTPSTFSREGDYHWVNQVTPVSARDQLIGRTLGSALISAALAIFVVVLCAFYVPMPLVSLVATGICASVVSVPVLISGLIIDLKRPMLKWDNPAAPVKQNFNTPLNMLAGMVYTGVMVGLGFLLNALVHNVSFVLLILSVLALGVAYLLGGFFIKKYDNWMIDD